MRLTLLSLPALCASTAIASTSTYISSIPNSLLFGRATLDCSSGNVACGSTCIPSDYTCCPDESGGCSANDVCQMGDNNAYGCCPEGELCTGDGGAQFIDEKVGGSDNSSSNSNSTSSSNSSSDSNGAGALSVTTAGLAVAVAAGVFAWL